MSTCRTTNPMAVGGPMFCQMEQDHLGRHGYVDGDNTFYSWDTPALELERDRFKAALERIAEWDLMNEHDSDNLWVTFMRIAEDTLRFGSAVKDTPPAG